LGVALELRQDRVGDGPAVEGGAVGVPLVDGLEELVIARSRSVRAAETHGGKQVRVGGVGERCRVPGVPEVSKCHDDVGQGGPAADHQGPVVGVDHRQPAAAVGVQVQEVVADREPPGLGVVP
jgi:hypothetical protein